MLGNKADFVLTYNETLGKSLHSQSVDWSQSRVVFISQHFTEYQRQAADFKDITLALYEIKRYEGGIIAIHPIKKTAAASRIKPLARDDIKLQQIAREIQVYTEADHTSNQSDSVVELYETYRDALTNLSDGIEIVPRKKYISFQKEGVLCDIAIQKNGLKRWINRKKGTLDDPKNLMEGVADKGHWGTGDYELKLRNTQNLEYIMRLVKQSL